VGKFHFQLLEFDFRFSPFVDLSRYIFPFRKPQVVLKIGKKITVTKLTASITEPVIVNLLRKNTS
jgi:hypothetical protein